MWLIIFSIIFRACLKVKSMVSKSASTLDFLTAAETVCVKSNVLIFFLPEVSVGGKQQISMIKLQFFSFGIIPHSFETGEMYYL